MSDRAIVLPHRGVYPEIDPSAFLAPGAAVLGDVRIGPDSSIWFQCVVRGDVNRIRIGARTNIQDGTIVHVTTERWPTTIEDDVTVGHRAVLHGCHVKRGALIGIGALVLDGAVIGEGAQVAAGAVVPPRMEVPARTLVMGMPAKVKRELGEEESRAFLEQAARYVELARRYREAP